MQRSHGWCSEGTVRVCRGCTGLCAKRALNGKMSEASLMSFASTLRRGKRSAHSSSALSEIALKRSFFSGTAAAMSIDVSASADTSIEASTSCIHTPAVARAARALDAGVNVDSCSAVASAGSMRSRVFIPPAASGTRQKLTILYNLRVSQLRWSQKALRRAAFSGSHVCMVAICGSSRSYSRNNEAAKCARRL